MIIPKHHADELIAGILPLLIDCYEDTERVRNVMGNQLISEGVNYDIKGKPIVKTKKYVIADTVRMTVNHKRRLRDVIDRAKTLQGMEDDLARYLAKYGKSKETITNSIPPHLRNNQP